MAEENILKTLKLGYSYLSGIEEKGFSIIDLNMIEPFSEVDKAYQPTSITFEKNDLMLAIRSDWTRSILAYKDLYDYNKRKLSYFGPIIREGKTIYQTGCEIYDKNDKEVIEILKWHLDFVSDKTCSELGTITVNDQSLIDLYINKFDLPDSIRKYINQKDISSIGEECGVGSLLYRLMVAPVSQQFDLIKEDFSDAEIVKKLEFLKENLKDYNMKFIVDLSFSSPQGYYDGFYFQAFLDNGNEVLSGGEYGDNSFGIGLDLTGGLV